MKPLVEFYDGEPWFDNPQLIIAGNRKRKRSKKRGSTMARVHRRRSRARSNRRRKHARRNFYGAGALANRPRRRRRSFKRNEYLMMNRKRRRRRGFKMNRRRRHYQSNPGGMRLMGFSLPPLDAVLWVGSGLVVPPLVAAQIIKFVPDSLKTSAATTWLVKGASVVVPGMLLRRFVNPRAGNLYMVGGLASLVMDAIRTFAPGVIPGLGYQPLLGTYFSQPVRTASLNRAPARGTLPPMMADAPGRLDASERF